MILLAKTGARKKLSNPILFRLRCKNECSSAAKIIFLRGHSRKFPLGPGLYPCDNFPTPAAKKGPKPIYTSMG